MPEAKGSDFPTKPQENIPGRTPKRQHLAEILQRRAEAFLHSVGHIVHGDADTIQAHTQKLFDEHVEAGHIGSSGLHTEDMFDQTTALPPPPRYPNDRGDVSSKNETTKEQKDTK